MESIREGIERFLNQELELYGDDLVMERPAQIEPDEPWKMSRSLDELYHQIKDCTKCPLGKTRQHFVFGEGNPEADILLVGEAPGADEDRVGKPFVGAAGQLLTKILAAIELKREEVYICNILKCRPPHNRDPLPEEIEKCEPYLQKQIELISPEFILCLGRFAAQTLLKTTASLGALRGRVHRYQQARLIVTYHPAALLRFPQYKRQTWEDVQLLQRLYEEWKRTKN